MPEIYGRRYLLGSFAVASFQLSLGQLASYPAIPWPVDCEL